MGRIDGWYCENNKREKIVFCGDILRTEAEAKLLRHLARTMDAHSLATATAAFNNEEWLLTPVTFVPVGG